MLQYRRLQALIANTVVCGLPHEPVRELELGGKNPAIVLDCQDLDGAASEIVAAAFLCSGQRCTALSRVIVQDSLADALIERLLAHMKKIRVGNGLEPGTTMGPLVSREQMEIVSGYVRKGVESEAMLLAGGQVLTSDPQNQGYFYAPTLFDRVAPESPLALEEIFGPVLPVIRVPDAEQSFQIANSTRYGLAASLFTPRQPWNSEPAPHSVRGRQGLGTRCIFDRPDGERGVHRPQDRLHQMTSA